MRQWTAYLLAATVCLFVWSPSSSAGNYHPQVGQPHGDFLLPDIADGRATRLSEFRGRKVLLIHFASW